MAESRATVAGAYVEIGGALVKVTQAGAYVEIARAQAQATVAGLYVELVQVLDYYAVGDGSDVPDSFLSRLTPQPSSAGVKVTRRTHDIGAPLRNEFKYIELVYSALGSVSEYQAVLTAFGVLSALQNEVTVTAKDETLGWARFNGTAVRPEMGRDIQWSRHFPRDVVILVKFLEPSA